MLAEALTALAAAGGTAVVQAAGKDAWTGFRARVAKWFARGDTGGSRSRWSASTGLRPRWRRPGRVRWSGCGPGRKRRGRPWFELLLEGLDGTGAAASRGRAARSARRLRGRPGRRGRAGRPGCCWRRRHPRRDRRRGGLADGQRPDRPPARRPCRAGWRAGGPSPAGPVPRLTAPGTADHSCRQAGRPSPGRPASPGPLGRACRARRGGRGLDRHRQLGPGRAAVRSAYRKQVERIAPPELVGREAELRELAAYCTEPGRGPYVWWRARRGRVSRR